jgi:hypothetical protein
MTDLPKRKDPGVRGRHAAAGVITAVLMAPGAPAARVDPLAIQSLPIAAKDAVSCVGGRPMYNGAIRAIPASESVPSIAPARRAAA